MCFLAFMPKNRLELGRFQNYSISIFADFGKYSKIDFFTISILKNWAKIVDSSISIKIDPALLSSIIMTFVGGIWRRYEITYYVHTLALLPGTGSDGSSLRSFRKRNTLLDKTPTFYGRVTIYFGKTKNKNFVVRSRNL